MEWLCQRLRARAFCQRLRLAFSGGGRRLGTQSSVGSVLVKVRQPSGEVAFEEELPLCTTVRQVLVKLCAHSELSHPGQLTLLRGSEKLRIGASLAEVGLVEGDELLLVRGGLRTTYVRCHAPSNSEYMFRMMLLGPAATGKTAFLNQAARGTFDPLYICTIGVDFALCGFQAEDVGRIRLQLWDTSGQERFRTVTMSHCRNHADAYLVFFNLAERKTFDAMSQFVRDAKNMGSRRKEMILVIVGTHSDLDSVVSSEEAQAAADSFGATYHEVCCSDADTVNRVVHSTLDRLLEPELFGS